MSDPSPLCRDGEATLGVLCGGLGSALQGKKCGRSGESLIKGDKDNEETGSFLLQEKNERDETAHPGKEKIWGISLLYGIFE